MTFKRVALTGHRPGSLTTPQREHAKSELMRLAAKLKNECNTQIAISGMAIGADTWWAQAALTEGLDLWAYIPTLAQPSRWQSRDRHEWEQLRKQATREVVIGKGVSAGLFHARNDAMLRDCDALIAVHAPSVTTGGTVSTMGKAKRREIPVITVDVESLRTTLKTGQ